MAECEEPKAAAVDVVEIRGDVEEDFENEPQSPITDHVSKSATSPPCQGDKTLAKTETTTSQTSPSSQPDAAELERHSKSSESGAESLATKAPAVKIVESLPPVPYGRLRSEALHLYGVDDMSTEDVLDLFSLYGPGNVEWINDKSCNVAWEDEELARRALNGVGQQRVAVEEGEDTQGSGGKNEEGEKEVKGREEEEEEEEGESESGGRVRWWTVGPHSKAEQLLLRLATTGDVKLPGSARRSQYYKKYGNPNLGPTDLRGRLVRKRSHSKGESTEEGEEEDMDVEQDLLSTLVKRPKPMHADRGEDEEEEEERKEGNGERFGREGGGEGGTDLRGLLKKKRKRRSLQMRLGTYPRLVEEHI